MNKKTNTKKRAISNKAKAERKQAIIDSAKELYEKEKNLSIPISDIAKNAGLAKGTVYLYFKTREAMDLEILRQIIKDCFDKIDLIIKTKPLQDAIINLLSDFGTDFLIVNLGSRYNLLMEKCGDYETIVAFKEFLNKRIEITSISLKEFIPSLETKEVIELFIGSFSLMIGLSQMAEPAFIAKEVLEARGLENLKLDFEEVFPKLLRNLWSGVLN